MNLTRLKYKYIPMSSRYKILFFLFMVTFLSCKNDEATTDGPTYSGVHELSVDSILISGSSSIKVKFTSNLAYDPGMNEVGVLLLDNTKKVIDRKVLDIATLKPKETIYFDNLSSNTYSVRSYLIHNNRKDTVFSNTKMITVQNIDFSDYAITSYPTYQASNGKAVYSRNTGEFMVLFFHTDRDLALEEIKVKLSNGMVISPASVNKENWSELKKYEYYIQLNITDAIPSGLYDIELLENNISYSTGIVLDKLSGAWERVKSLFPGERRGGNRVYFQSGKDAYIGIADYAYVSNSKIDLLKFDLESYAWSKLSPLELSPRTIGDYQNRGIVINNMAYVSLNTFYDYELWGYDMVQDKWSFVTSAPEEMKRIDGVMMYFLNNKLYLAGGAYTSSANQFVYLSNVWCYDIATKEWTKKNNKLPFNFRGYSSYYSTFSSSKSTYLIFNSTLPREFWRYTEDDDTWTKLSMSYPLLSECGSTVYHNRLFYYVGGRLLESFYEGSTKRCYTYSEETNTWKQIADLPNEISGGTAFDYNNQLYVGMGIGSYESTVSMFKYNED